MMIHPMFMAQNGEKRFNARHLTEKITNFASEHFRKAKRR